MGDIIHASAPEDRPKALRDDRANKQTADRSLHDSGSLIT